MSHMLLSRGDYTRVVQAIQSSNGTAAYLSDTARLVDHIPSSQCAISWPSGAQTTGVYVHLPFRMTPAPAAECRVFALLGLRGIPVNTLVHLYGGATSNPTTLRAQGRTVRLPGGGVGIWFARQAGSGWSDEYFAFRIYNDTGGVATIAASTTVYVGELYATPVWEWPVSQWEPRVVNPAQVNRSSSGVVRHVPRPSYRTVDLTVAPQQWEQAQAANSGNTMQDMLYDLQGQRLLAVIPRPNRRGASLNADQTAIAATAMLCGLTDNGGFGSDAGTDAYPLRLALEECL